MDDNSNPMGKWRQILALDLASSAEFILVDTTAAAGYIGLCSQLWWPLGHGQGWCVRYWTWCRVHASCRYIQARPQIQITCLLHNNDLELKYVAPNWWSGEIKNGHTNMRYSETPNLYKDIRGSSREHTGRPSSLRPSGCTIWEWALVGSQRSRQARRPPTSPQSTSQVHPGRAAHNPKGALIRESGLTPAPVMLDSRQQQWAARLANAYSSKLREMHKDPSSSTPKHRVAEIKHKQSQRAEGMSWPPPVEEPVVKTILLDDKGTAKRAVQCWATEKEVTVGAGVWMWWTDASRSGNGRVGAAALYIHDNEWRTHRSRLGAGWMEFFNAELWVIGLMPGETVKRRQTRQKNGVKMVAVCNNSQAAIRWTASLELCAGQWIARRINRRLQVLLTHAIATQIHWVLGYLGIPRHKEADCHANLARQTTGRMVIERPYSSALNRDWQISEGWSAAKAKWVADKCTSTLDTDSMARRGPRDLFQWRAWSCWLPGSTDYSAGMDPLDST